MNKYKCSNCHHEMVLVNLPILGPVVYMCVNTHCVIKSGIVEPGNKHDDYDRAMKGIAGL